MIVQTLSVSYDSSILCKGLENDFINGAMKDIVMKKKYLMSWFMCYRS